MKRLLLIAVVSLFCSVAMADVNVFLDHSTAQCPQYTQGPMTGYWESSLCHEVFSSWPAPSGFTCITTETVWHYVCKNGCCNYTYYSDNDNRTMNNSCTSFTSAQTYFHD